MHICTQMYRITGLYLFMSNTLFMKCFFFLAFRKPKWSPNTVQFLYQFMILKSFSEAMAV